MHTNEAVRVVDRVPFGATEQAIVSGADIEGTRRRHDEAEPGDKVRAARGTDGTA